MQDNTTRQQPKKIGRVLYFCNGRVVRCVTPGQNSSEVRHHAEKFRIDNSELFVATTEECKEYVKKP